MLSITLFNPNIMKTKIMIIITALATPFGCLAAADNSKVVLNDPNNWQIIISLLPVAFFVLILLITMIKLKNDKVKLSDLLTEKDPILPAAVAPVAGAPAPVVAPAVAAPAMQQSASRFIAFLTGLVALTIGVCVCTFYIYSYFSNPGTPAVLTNLTNVIWGLGIGVLPYGFNKISSATKP